MVCNVWILDDGGRKTHRDAWKAEAEVDTVVDGRRRPFDTCLSLLVWLGIDIMTRSIRLRSALVKKRYPGWISYKAKAPKAFCRKRSYDVTTIYLLESIRE